MSLEAPITMAAHAPFLSENHSSPRSPPPMPSTTNLRTSPAPAPSPSTPSHASADPSTPPTSTTAAPRSEINGADASPLLATDAEVPPAAAAASIALDHNADVDPQIIEALKSKDRLFVLKLGDLMESLINDRKPRIEVTAASSYQRLLVHRGSAYYKCTVESESNSKVLVVSSTAESKVPARRIADLVPPEAPAQHAFKIMRRASRDRLKKSGFSGGSAAGEDGDLSDPEPSEAGSLHSRDARKHKTIEERQAAYQTARERIFQDFQEKEREREKDGSATSSTFSGAPGSASTSAAPSTVDDLESESVAAESEWSATGSRDRRRGNGSASSRPWKPNGYRSGSHSARGSRGTSPSSIQYPSIYEPPAPVQYEGAPAPGVPPPPGYAHYGYSYAPQQGQGPGQPYMAPFPQYYQHQSYAYPTHPTHHSDPTTPAATDIYGQYPLQPHMYPGGYAWPPMSAPPMQQISTSPPQHPVPPPTMHVPHTAPYLPPQQYMQPPAPYAPYQPQGYYVPPPHNGQMPPPPPPHQMHGQPMYSMDPVRSMSGSHHGTTPGHSRASSRSSQGRRSAPPVRSAWSYGPGATGGAYYGSDVVGPRMGGIRRMSGASSVGSGSTGNRTPGGDDASSTVSSSTSSSSARTFTSTSTSSKHPLPARPDWAIGLRPEGSSRHHDSAPRGRNSGPGPQGQPPAPLQPGDFPPLSAAPPPPRAPVAGAWTNSSSVRSILAPGAAAQPHAHGNALVQYPPHGGPSDQDKTFERPPPKGAAELFNPKSGPTPRKGQTKGNEVKKGTEEAGALVDKMGVLSIAPGPST